MSDLPPAPFAVVAPTPFYTPGGCSARVLGEIEGISAFCRSPTVFTYGTGADLPGLEVVRAGPQIRGLATGLHWSRPGMDVLLARAVLARRELPGSLHVHLYEGGSIGALIRKLRGIPYVVDLQGSLVEETSRYLRRGLCGVTKAWLRRVERLAEDGASFIVTSSPSMVRFLREHSPRTADRIVFLDDGVPEHSILSSADRDKFRAAARAKESRTEGDFVIAYLGSLSPTQGIDRLLESAPEILRQIPNAVFRLYGVPNPGSTLREYRDRCTRLGIGSQVQFPGPVPYDDTSRVLAAADVAVTWKTNPLEANGKVPVYMAAGIPTVGIRTPITEHYLGTHGEKGGLLAETAQEALAGVVRLAGDPSLRQRLGDAALAAAHAELTWQSRGQRILQLHKQAGAA